MGCGEAWPSDKSDAGQAGRDENASNSYPAARWPVFAVQEGERLRTGFDLTTPSGTVQRFADEPPDAADLVGLALERRLRAGQPLAPRMTGKQVT